MNWMRPLSPILFSLTSLRRGSRLLKKWRNSRALVRRREELSLMLQAEKNRLEGIAPNVRCSVERLLSVLSAEKARLEKLILRQIHSQKQLLCDHQLLCSIKGIGSLTAAILLAEIARPAKSSALA